MSSIKTFVHRPQSVWLRRALFQVHLWTGIFLCVYIFVSCVTGSALMFRIEMQRALQPHLFTPTASGPPADPITVMERVGDAYPQGRVSGVDAPTEARPTYLVYVVEGGRSRGVLVDPASITVLGELQHTFVNTLQDLHFDLMAGRMGRRANGIGGFLVLAMCITGLVIWWPGLATWRRAFLVDFSRGWRRINWELHSALGIWAVTLIAMWAATGAYFGFPGQFRSLIGLISPISTSRAPQSQARPAERGAEPSLSALVAAARRRVPDQHVARIVAPANERAPFQVMFSPDQPTPAGGKLTPVYLDQHTGALLADPRLPARTLGDSIVDWIVRLHFGSFGGTGVKIAWFVLGLSPVLLFLTGFIMWWVRVVRPRWLAAGALARRGTGA